jgi:hypothetical protein
MPLFCVICLKARPLKGQKTLFNGYLSNTNKPYYANFMPKTAAFCRVTKCHIFKGTDSLYTLPQLLLNTVTFLPLDNADNSFVRILFLTEVLSMNRSYLAKRTAQPIDVQELSRKTAIHEAGHAAAIYFGNKHQQLPPVCFQILISGLNHPPSQHRALTTPWIARVDGGRLIHTLPSSVTEATRGFSHHQKQAYLKAFDADIVNLLVGPLAEANYIALRDDEIINSRLVNINALHHYGGAADLWLVEEYLTCLGLDAQARTKKIDALFGAAFTFINERGYWRAIIRLANHILANRHYTIDYSAIAAVLDGSGGLRQQAA